MKPDRGLRRNSLSCAFSGVSMMRSPSYLVRQLYDMQRGNRNGAWTPLMASAVAHLGPDDLLTAAAYLASLKP